MTVAREAGQDALPAHLTLGVPVVQDFLRICGDAAAAVGGELARTFALCHAARAAIEGASPGEGPASLPAADGREACSVGAVLLLLFIQANWLGPAPGPPADALLASDAARTQCMHALAIDGEASIGVVSLPWLLVAALHYTERGASSSGAGRWWHVRALFAHQRILQNSSESLQESLCQAVTDLAGDMAAAFGPQLLVEGSLICQQYGKEAPSTDLLARASASAGFSHALTGLLGRRTRFQTFDVAQLVVETASPGEGAAACGNGAACHDANGNGAACHDAPIMPRHVELEHEYIMDKAVIPDEAHQQRTSTIGRAILLATCGHILAFHAADEAILERTMALVAKIVDSPSQWCIYSGALFVRCTIEGKKRRLVERAALQYEALYNQSVEGGSPASPSFDVRVGYFFATPYPARWDLDRLAGRLFVGIGAFRTAAGLFERAQLWDEHILCLIQLGEIATAERLLEGAIQKSPTNGNLLCILGDMRGDAALYREAWRVSKGRCARAMRSLAIALVKEGDFVGAREALEKALALNGLYEKMWFLLGCVHMHLEEWPRALAAFTRTVALDSENGEAWNNLAAVHLRLDQRDEALGALREAAKRQHDSWKIWQNIFQVALSAGNVAEAIQAYRRTAEIREKAVDLAGLHALLDALQRAITTFGRGDRLVASLERLLDGLLDEVMATHLAMRPDFWLACAAYARIVGRMPDHVEFHFKAHRAMTGLPVDRVKEAFDAVLANLEATSAAIDLAAAAATASSGGAAVQPPRAALAEQRTQLRLMARSLGDRAAGGFAEGADCMRRLQVLIEG